ncbi:phosphoadenosine phosphosulfate reductase family protein [Bradyrhizobium sp. LB11.1]|uniref:phosphoadenosine phosphosulfate reductase domain-containing protein n=1 Tax=Bradyrhizobium sp. LB11.1 TaxID=3156326 RepID=UPI0033964AAB
MNFVPFNAGRTGRVLPKHLKSLESQSIEIMREVIAEFKRPVMLYSIGKDSSVMLHLALKAFHPARLPFPLLHVDTTWNWHYIQLENIPVVPLYFAKHRPVVARGGSWIMVDDERLPLNAGEQPESRRIRFRTLGCYPLTGAIDSSAATLEDIMAEMRSTRLSERQGRLIDSDEPSSMERKKREGYF